MDRVLLKSRRALVVFCYDALSSCAAWALAFLLRFNLELTPNNLHALLVTMPFVVLVQSIVFWIYGLYRGVWRYASLSDLRRIGTSMGTAVPCTVMLLMVTRQVGLVPRSVWFLDGMLLLILMGGARMAYRVYKEFRRFGRISGAEIEPVLILGAGSAGVDLLRQFEKSSRWNVVGVLDDDAAMHGRLVYGYNILGKLDSLPKWKEFYDVKYAILAMPSATYAERRRAIDVCKKAGVTMLTIPSLGDIISGRVEITKIKKFDVEDLLGREPVVLDSAGLSSLLSGKAVMVTGAGGSIGSELCRQIAKFKPRQLIFYDISEPALFELEQEFTRLGEVPFVPLVGDVKNESRLDFVMRRYAPALVFHAAAYKHVPLMETHNSLEALQNNVFGTYALARAAVRNGVTKFVLISTDKAVNPSNVMGATKRLAEMVCQSLQNTSDTQFITVRFGNVLGSRGSVIPKFRQQIVEGGPVTVTHPEITRFFMSIPEAAQLVLQSALMGEGGEIFVLDMGTPIRIADLARDMIRLSGIDEEEVRVVFTGLREGEKLHEELLASGETTLKTPHPKLQIAKARPVNPGWLDEILEVLRSGTALTDHQVKKLIAGWITEANLLTLRHGEGVEPKDAPPFVLH
jgi:FlaA1/EpsC-like NDP-sugar epimerase